MNNLVFEKILNNLKSDEGWRELPYRDELGGKKVKSTGYGFNLNEPYIKEIFKKFGINPNEKLSKENGDRILRHIISNITVPSLKASVKNFDELPDSVKDALVNVHYQIGDNSFRGFKKMLRGLNERNFKMAEREMGDSNYGRNVALKNRSLRNRRKLYPQTEGKYIPSKYDIQDGIGTWSYLYRDKNHKPVGLVRPTNKNNNQPSSVNRVIPRDTNSNNTEVPNGYYRIRKGDTIDSISKKYNLNKKLLLKNNPSIKDANKIYEGQIIKTSAILNSLLSKSADMKKEIPVNDILSVKPVALNKNNIPIFLKKLFNRKKYEDKGTIKNDFNEALGKKASDSTDKLSNILDSIYNEKKEYWPNGLSLILYTGDKDKLMPIKNKNNKLIGFKGCQIRDGNKAYYSVGLIPEERGNGIAFKEMDKFIDDNKNKKYIHYYTAHRDNKPSLALFHKLLQNHPNLNIKVFN